MRTPDTVPSIPLAEKPTPLRDLPNLTHVLNGPRILVKRDDMTGLALGGNKTRKLEYLMAEVQRTGADYIVTGAGFHSNWCTQAVAAARRLGMGALLVKAGPADGWEPQELDGNHLLHAAMNAEIRVARPEHLEAAMAEAVDDLRRRGHHPEVLTNAGSTPLGALGYVNAMREMAQQASEMGIDIDYVVHPTGTGGTQAGLVLGSKVWGVRARVMGVSVGLHTQAEQEDLVHKLVADTAAFLQVEGLAGREDVIVKDGYHGGGYGFFSRKKAEAVQLAAAREGLFIDPVYTGSALACLIDLCRQGFFKPGDVVVFLHTGGQAALFPYRNPLASFLKGHELSWRIPAWNPRASDHS
jgi:D-cysteine desulfhydrase family pyridoxal phosphate-dependent enzyme